MSRSHCEGCGEPIPPERMKRRAIYCSTRCKDRFNVRNRRRRERLKALNKLPEYLDGRGFAEWFRANYLSDSELAPLNILGDSGTRLLFACENEGRNPSVYSVDRLLTRLGGHIHEIPEHLWVYGRARPHRNYSAEEKRRALHMLDEGMTRKEVARAMGCSVDSINNWRRKKATA